MNLTLNSGWLIGGAPRPIPGQARQGASFKSLRCCQSTEAREKRKTCRLREEPAGRVSQEQQQRRSPKTEKRRNHDLALVFNQVPSRRRRALAPRDEAVPGGPEEQRETRDDTRRRREPEGRSKGTRAEPTSEPANHAGLVVSRVLCTYGLYCRSLCSCAGIAP